MAESMVERVARAIFDACGKQSTVIVLPWEAQDQDDFRAIARAAIAAMREPTEAMLESVSALTMRDNTPGMDWRLMIDAALSEPQEDAKG